MLISNIEGSKEFLRVNLFARFRLKNCTFVETLNDSQLRWFFL